MPPKLRKYYLRATVIPTIISLLGMVGWLVGEHRWGSFSQIKVADLEGENIDLTLFLVALGNCFLFAALTTPLFLNAFQKVRSKPIISLLSWNALPLAWSVYIINDIGDSDLEIVILLMVGVLPYLIAIPWTFILYRRALPKAGSPGADTAATPSLNDSAAADPIYPQQSPPATPGAPEY